MARNAELPTLTLLEDVEKCEKELVEGLLGIPVGKSCRLLINSGGGSVYAAMGVCTVIRMRRLKVEAVVLADCSSSALMIFAAAHKRLMAPHASCLFHPMRWSGDENCRLPAARSWTQEFGRMSDVMENFLVENLPLARRTLRQWVRDERYVLATELVEAGLAEMLDLGQEGVIDISAAARTRSRRNRPAAHHKAG